MFVQINEIYVSIQGESEWAGRPTTFIRTTGCPVRCSYCDTEYAFHGGDKRSIESIVAEVKELGPSHICLTGGEPLAQKSAWELLKALIEADFHVSVETSGVRTIADLPRPLKVVLDLKTPGSNVLDQWLPENISLLQPGDELKTVITSRADWDWYIEWLEQNQAAISVGIGLSVSPVWSQVTPAELSDWLLQSNKEVRLNLQLHKIIWPTETRGR